MAHRGITRGSVHWWQQEEAAAIPDGVAVEEERLASRPLADRVFQVRAITGVDHQRMITHAAAEEERVRRVDQEAATAVEVEEWDTIVPSVEVVLTMVVVVVVARVSDFQQARGAREAEVMVVYTPMDRMVRQILAAAAVQADLTVHIMPEAAADQVL